MPRSTFGVLFSLLMLVGSVWMALSPRELIGIFQGLQDGVTRLPPGSPRFMRPGGPLPDDRRTRVGIRLFGLLLASVAAAHLYQNLVWMLTH